MSSGQWITAASTFGTKVTNTAAFNQVNTVHLTCHQDTTCRMSVWQCTAGWSQVSSGHGHQPQTN